MSVIEASSGTYRSRVDGTIVLSVEIEPRFRAEALALFGMPGTPMALAALKVGRAAEPEPEKPPRERLGPLCEWAVMRCRERDFWRFLHVNSLQPVTSADDAAELVHKVCGIKSRKELDTDDRAGEVFAQKFMQPYRNWVAQQEQTA